MRARKLREALALGLLLAIQPVVSGCSGRPEGVLSDSRTVDLLADMYIADAYVAQNAGAFPTDSARKGFRQSVLLRHGINEKELDATLEWYGLHFDKYVELHDKVDKKIASRADRYTSARNKIDREDAADNLWNRPRVLRLSPLSATRGVYFEIDVKRLKKGDRLLWNFRIVNPEANVQAFMAAVYPGGHVHSLSHDISTPGTKEIEFQTDSAKLPDRIAGFIRLKGSATSAVWIDSISMASSAFDRSRYRSIRSLSVFNPDDRKNTSPATAAEPFNPDVMPDDPSFLPASARRPDIRRGRMNHPVPGQR